MSDLSNTQITLGQPKPSLPRRLAYSGNDLPTAMQGRNYWKKYRSDVPSYQIGDSQPIVIRLSSQNFVDTRESMLAFTINNGTGQTMCFDFSSYSIFDRLVIKSSSGRVLEDISDYGAIMKFLLVTRSDADYLRTIGSWCFGHNAAAQMQNADNEIPVGGDRTYYLPLHCGLFDTNRYFPAPLCGAITIELYTKPLLEAALFPAAPAQVLTIRDVHFHSYEIEMDAQQQFVASLKNRIAKTGGLLRLSSHTFQLFKYSVAAGLPEVSIPVPAKARSINYIVTWFKRNDARAPAQAHLRSYTSSAIRNNAEWFQLEAGSTQIPHERLGGLTNTGGIGAAALTDASSMSMFQELRRIHCNVTCENVQTQVTPNTFSQGAVAGGVIAVPFTTSGGLLSNCYLGIDLELYKNATSNGFDTASRSIPMSMRIGFAAGGSAHAVVSHCLVSHDVDFYVDLTGDILASY